MLVKVVNVLRIKHLATVVSIHIDVINNLLSSGYIIFRNGCPIKSLTVIEFF